MVEKKRCVDSLHSVFDLPYTGGVPVDLNEPARVMMSYNRARNSRKLQVVNRGLAPEDKRVITSWLQKNSHICDAINGIERYPGNKG